MSATLQESPHRLVKRALRKGRDPSDKQGSATRAVLLGQAEILCSGWVT